MGFVLSSCKHRCLINNRYEKAKMSRKLQVSKILIIVLYSTIVPSVLDLHTPCRVSRQNIFCITNMTYLNNLLSLFSSHWHYSFIIRGWNIVKLLLMFRSNSRLHNRHMWELVWGLVGEDLIHTFAVGWVTSKGRRLFLGRPHSRKFGLLPIKGKKRSLVSM